VEIAYIVLAHKYPEQLARLINKLNTEATSFFIHVDKKTDAQTYAFMVERLKHLSNVRFYKRHKCYWGDFSQVVAAIQGIKEIVKQGKHFDWVILLTGQDYPIKSNRQIENFLESNQNQLFIENFALPRASWIRENGGLDRIEYRHFRLFNKKIRFTDRKISNSRVISVALPSYLSFLPIKRKFFNGIKPFVGSPYWILSYECIKYIDQFIAQNPKFMKFFQGVHCADEIFFQTVVLSSHFSENVVDNSLRYTDWSAGGSNPAILGEDDFLKLKESTALFARKFDMMKDEKILDMLDEYIREPHTI
jgi:hypothetical protein